MSTEWTVHKFGGTSVADADRYRAACEIVLSQRSGERVAVVVSAMSGVTNALIEAVNLAAAQDETQALTWTDPAMKPTEPATVCPGSSRKP